MNVSQLDLAVIVGDLSECFMYKLAVNTSNIVLKQLLLMKNNQKSSNPLPNKPYKNEDTALVKASSAKWLC